jgi:hypothetical protein
MYMYMHSAHLTPRPAYWRPWSGSLAFLQRRLALPCLTRMDMRRKTRSHPPAKVPSSAQPSTPTVRLAEQIQRERGRGVGFQRAGAASRRGSSGTQEPAGTRRPRRAAGRGGGRAGQRGHHDSGGREASVQRLCCAASAPQHTAGLPRAAAWRPAAAQPRRAGCPAPGQPKP